MARIIAGIYELQEQIGAGGGGTVYLGRHMRLEKQVILKADKRKLSKKPEVLRREVDMLKGLSHRYIPQVYDFVQEDGTVYTVMDFIEGESLDKLLGRGQIPSQPQLIRWACQLLEALSYLHSRPPHGILHGDIKPANIMLRPDGDICLIDYNIALALGENGAVKAGFSIGYASPEHYGREWMGAGQSRNEVSGHSSDSLATVTAGRGNVRYGEDSSGGRGEVMLDVRSDIYSLGATLYHLLSGQRPARDALEVAPLTADVCSPEVSAIIHKAMEPVPDMRYQTAEDMLTAFLQLHRRDGRIVRHRKRMLFSAVLLTAVFLLGGACAMVGLKQLEHQKNALALSEYSADALLKGDVSGAVSLALQAIPSGKSILEAPVTAQAQKALADALGVYDLSDGFKALATVSLPSAPFKIAVSPEGTAAAAVYAYEAAIYNTESCENITTLALRESALSDVAFINETCVVYAGEKGVTAYEMKTESVMWTGDAATTLAVSGNGSVVAALDRKEGHAVIYRTSDGAKVNVCSFGGRYMPSAVNDIFADSGDAVFALNEDGSLLAVSFSGGGLTVFDLNNPDNNMVLYDESDYVYFNGGFSGQYFAFSAGKSGESIFGMLDTAEAAYLEGYRSRNNILLQADGQGIYLSDGNLLVKFDPDTLMETELAYTGSVNITGFSIGSEYVLAATDDNCFSFYDRGANCMSTESSSENCDFVALAGGYAIIGSRNEPSVRILELENHKEEQLLTYDARYIHDEARISQDGRTAMLFNYQGFRIYNMEGRLLKQLKMPDAKQIYDQQFRKGKESSWLEVTWYDGTVRCYSAADGSLMSENTGGAPSTDLYEEFYTEQYRITSSLHTAPIVYEINSDKPVAVLEEDGYLTYVTQLGENLITEYISAAGERYGLLLDSDFQVLAYLPKLCDVAQGKLIFDYESGDLRQCRLYSLGELVALGETRE